MKKWLKNNDTVLFIACMAITLAVACTFLGYGLSISRDESIKSPGSQLAQPKQHSALDRDNYGKRTFSEAPHQLDMVLSEKDRDRYIKIFALQKQGKWKEAIELSDEVRNKTLLGYVLADRYLAHSYRSKYDDLASWMDNYSDHPMAININGLAANKAPKGIRLASFSSQPALQGYGDSNGLSGKMEDGYTSLLNWSDRGQAESLWNQLHEYVRQGQSSEALKIINNNNKSRILKAIEQDIVLTNIAMGYYYNGHDSEAYSIAKRAADRSGDRVPASNWIAGLSAWRMGKINKAATHFGKSAASDEQSEWDRSSSAFWAYRSYRSLGSPRKAEENLRIAMKYPRTFYGILARKTAGESLELDAKPISIYDSSVEEIISMPEIQRAAALIEVDQREMAEDEVRQLARKLDDSELPALASVATRLGLPAVEIRLARTMLDKTNDDMRFDYARYPVLPIAEESMFIEPSLIFAITREESGFNPSAQSYAGARGMMQLMPATARHVAKIFDLPYRGDSDLSDPDTNLYIGQAYVAHLLEQPEVGDNLFYLLAAYNAGPGNLSRWKKSVSFRNDPLLFIESIPVRETRNYVEQVSASYWIYREITGTRNNSVQAAINNEWPTI